MARMEASEDRKEQIRSLLTDAITVLCKNTMLYNTELSVEGLLGITTDKNDIVLVNIKEIITNNKVSSSVSVTRLKPEVSDNQPDTREDIPRRISDTSETQRESDSPLTDSQSSQEPDHIRFPIAEGSFPMSGAVFPNVITIKDEPSEVVISDEIGLIGTKRFQDHSNQTISPNVATIIQTLPPPLRGPSLNWPAMYSSQTLTSPIASIPTLGTGTLPLSKPCFSPESLPSKSILVPTRFGTSAPQQNERTEQGGTLSSSSGTSPTPVRVRVQKSSTTHFSLGKKVMSDRYFCSCGQQFRHSSSLTRHLRMNEQAKKGGLVFKCHLCGSKMNRRDNLRSHMIKNHGVQFGLLGEGLPHFPESESAQHLSSMGINVHEEHNLLSENPSEAKFHQTTSQPAEPGQCSSLSSQDEPGALSLPSNMEINKADY